MITIIKFDNEKKYVNDFLDMPKKLYKKNNMEDRENVKKILLGNHPLNHYFTMYKFIAYNDKKTVGRFIVTEYPNDSTAYFGFYECIDNEDVAKSIFKYAGDFCKKKGFKKIIGPVDSSFWIKYRLKTNMFNKKPYTSEPYNKEYYLKQFIDNGFSICEKYCSNTYDKFDEDYLDEKVEKRYKQFIEKGYKIVKPQKADFDTIIKDVYRMIMELYKDFPIFKPISEEDFISIFGSMKKIVNMDTIRMAYYNNQAVGFLITLPNYNNNIYNINMFKLLKIIRTLKKPKEYIMLYLGVMHEHSGLSNAFAKTMLDEMKKNQATSIGALIKQGKVFNNCFKDRIKQSYEYVLLEKDL